MKYTFDKFQIELVTKQTPKLNKNGKLTPTINMKAKIPIRNIKTAQFTHRKNPQLQDQSIRKSMVPEINFGQQSRANITRSKSLKSDMKDRYKTWLNHSNVSMSLKEKQYRIFEQKCIDLLSKKKFQSQSQSEKRSEGQIANKQTFFGLYKVHQANESKTNTVEQMMNNIIQKFKQDSRQRNSSSKQFKKNIKSQQKQDLQEPFLTISNETSQQKKQSILKNGEDKVRVFSVVRSTQLRRRYQNEDIDRCQKLKNMKKYHNKDIVDRTCRVDQVENEEKMLHRSWKDIPDVTGIRVNKKLNQECYASQFNPLICTSLALSSPSRQIKRNILAFDHISLSPYRKIVTSSQQLDPSSKRKKIHLNKPSIIKKFMKFTKNTSDQQYNRKIKAYLDFLFKVNFSNNIYVSLQLNSLDDTLTSGESRKCKVYVGPGNNSLLVRSLLKRRDWLKVVDNLNEEGVRFYWTQNKIGEVHDRQDCSDNYFKQSLGHRDQKKQRSQNQDNKERKKVSLIKNLQQTHQLNTKILFPLKAQSVQSYIFPDGYQLPFPKEYTPNIITNHLPNNSVIGSKKNLFKSLFSYYTNIAKKDPFSVIPKTYHIKGPEDGEFRRFMKENGKQPNRLWIVKPGENTNRGNGIRLKPFKKIESLIKEKARHQNGQMMTYIVQSYINRPFLYNGRKFDIRHYMLLTCVNGILKAYWYRDGYIRTSSQPYSLQQPDNEFVHLTNDAIQLKSESYGLYQDANKLSYSQFQRYLDFTYPGRGYDFQNITKEMREVIVDVMKASYLNLDRERKRDNFELFGFDFMIDGDFRPYLIQINFNPCLVANCGVLNRIIPPLIENTLRLGLDPLLTPGSHLPVNRRNTLSENYLKNLRYELIFDQATLQSEILHNPELDQSDDEEEEEYCDNGKQIPENVTF